MLKSIISKLMKSKAEDKVVCGCYNATVQDLKNAVKNGAKSFEEVQAITKVGTGCGQCVKGKKELVNELIIRKKLMKIK